MKRRFSPKTILVALLLVLVLLFGRAWSIASAAQSAEPGETLYPVKVLLEKAVIATTSSAELDDGAVNNVDDGNANNVNDGYANNGNDGNAGNGQNGNY
jgi:hypothetical protein